MDSVKETRSFSDIVSILNEKVKKEKTKKGKKYYRGPTQFFWGILLTFFGLIYIGLTLFLLIPADDMTGTVVYIICAFASFLVAFVYFSDEEAHIYPKAFWYWILGEDPKTS